ncbi:MAG TPA: nitroreductase family protein [Opitutaceae bacterium]|nr:nitroreductase family protein [Opitutaceae bacterium]
MATAARKFFVSRLIWSIFVAHRRLYYLLRALHNGVGKNQRDEANIYNIRRNTHILEKALVNPRLKPTFGELYVANLVPQMRAAIASGSIDANTQAWAIAVLHRYFAVCQFTPKIKVAHDLFLRLRLDNTSPHAVPYLAQDRPPLMVSYDALLALAKRRRSIRMFLSKPVPVGDVKRAMAVAVESPSACNRQAFRFLLYTEEKNITRIVEIPMGGKTLKLPALIVIVGRYSGYHNEREIYCPIDDAMLSAMAFQFALETLGLSSVCINWPTLREKDEAIREVLDLELDEFVIMLLGLGYADPTGKIPYSAKRNVDEMLLVDQKLKPQAGPEPDRRRRRMPVGLSSICDPS